jgi:regulator of sirC expression with transglutaminase-like and TPR domain
MTEAIFALELTQFSADAIGKAQTVLEQIVAAVRQRLPNRHTPVQEIGLFKAVIFRDYGFAVRRVSLGRDFTLTNTLLECGGSCLGLTTVYVCVAEALGIPMVPLLFEGHIDVAHVGRLPALHIEPTLHGTFLTSEASLAIRGTQPEIASGLLTVSQFLAVHLSNRAAFVLAPEGRLEDAAFLLETAIQLFPAYKAAWINKAIVSLGLGERTTFEESLGRAMSLNLGPRFRRVVNNVAGLAEEDHFTDKEHQHQKSCERLVSEYAVTTC